MRFLNANARYPGSTHDATIWRSGIVLPLVESIYEQDRHTWLFGDSGYGLNPYMLVPHRNPNTTEEVQFNNVHAKIRSLIERSFGVLKNRWR